MARGVKKALLYVAIILAGYGLLGNLGLVLALFGIYFLQK